jgi:putative sterol carrier protein
MFFTFNLYAGLKAACLAIGKCGRAIQLLSRYVGSTPSIAGLVDGWNSTIQFDLTEEEPFYVQFDGASATFHEGSSENPDVVLSGRSDLFFDVISGKLDPDEAYMMKKYSVQGSVVDAMKFRRISELVEESHKSTFSVLKTFGKIAFR